jgi:hypothetical protein
MDAASTLVGYFEFDGSSGNCILENSVVLIMFM